MCIAGDKCVLFWSRNVFGTGGEHIYGWSRNCLVLANNVFYARDEFVKTRFNYYFHFDRYVPV